MQFNDGVKINKYRWVLSFTLFWECLAFSMGYCQASDAFFQEEQRYQAQQKAEQDTRRNEAKDIFLQQDVSWEESDLFPEETLMFPIQKIVLDGDVNQEFGWIQRKLNIYQNCHIGKIGIGNLVQLITKNLIAKGYATTKILVPEQDLSTGVLQLTILPGRIGQITILGETNAKWQSAFPLKQGDILNSQAIEQGLEQMMRVQSQDAQIQLFPGENLGETDIEITVKRGKQSRSMLVIDDGGAKEIGKIQARFMQNIDNLFNNNDTLSFAFGHDLAFDQDRKGMENYSIDYTFPYKNWTFTIDKYCYDYHQNLVGFGRDFQYSSKTNHIELTAQSLLKRGKRSKTNIAFTIGKQVTNKYLEDIFIDMQSQETTFGKVKLMHRWYNDAMVYDIGIGYKFNLPWFGAKPDVAEIVDNYNIWTFDGQVTMPIHIGGTKGWYSCQIWGQYTKDFIYPSDEFAIGGRYTVRGFDGEQTLSDENGFVVRNEWSFPDKENEYYFGIDWGRVSGRYTEEIAGHSLVGAVVGIRGGSDRMQYDVFVGCPIKKPQEYEVDSVCYGFELRYLL